MEDRACGLHSGPGALALIYIRPVIDQQSDLVSLCDANEQIRKGNVSIKNLDQNGEVLID